MPDLKLSKELSVAIQEFQSICDNSTSGSHYFPWGSQGYKDSIRHFLASSSEVAQLAVQPGSAEDLGKMMKVLKIRKVPFAVKGGGHGMAPTLSSTTGIQISMALFSQVLYDRKKMIVEIGAGCLWDQVYSALASFNRNVIGGASSEGVGVGGWLLGGGYSLKSNRYGLGIDHIVAYEIVTPDGRIRKVTAQQGKDLYQALRGGGNNFGIVTKFVLKTYPQEPTYGALLVVSGKRKEEVKSAIVDFVENEKRQEATIVAAFRHIYKDGNIESNISILCVFDAEKPKSKRDVPFQEFKRLTQSGEVWRADPAGWQLGQTNISIIDSSLKRFNPKPTRATPRARSQASNPLVKAKPSPIVSNYNTQKDRLPFLKATASDIPWFDEYKTGEDEDEDGDSESDCGFEMMSFRRRYQISSEMPPADTASISLGGTSDYESDENSEDATLFDFADEDEPDKERRFAKKESWKPRALYELDGIPQKIMVTRKVDNMGEKNERGRFGCIMVSKYTKPLLDKMAEEAEKSAQYLKSHRGLSVVVDCWPVHPSIFDNSPPGVAFPHKPGQPYGPMLAYFCWQNEEDDKFWITKLKGTLNRIRVVARNLGLTPRKPALYNNLSLETVPVHKIYRENMDWLRKVKGKYDPTDVMGQARGHKIPLPGTSNGNDLDSD